MGSGGDGVDGNGEGKGFGGGGWAFCRTALGGSQNRALAPMERGLGWRGVFPHDQVR